MSATVSPFSQPTAASIDAISAQAVNTSFGLSNNDANQDKLTALQENKSVADPSNMPPVQNVFYRHTLLSLARLNNVNAQSKEKTIVTTNSKSKIGTQKTLPSVENTIGTEQTKRWIRYIMIIGVCSSVVFGSLAIGSTALAFGLKQQVPTGTILLYSGSASGLMGVDNQWLFCNGSAVSRSTYSSLFRVIGTIYGSGDGIDTFNLPDFRARFPLGSLVPNDITLVSGGAASHILAIAELPAHDHSQGSLQTVADGVHTHSYTDPGHNHGGSTGSGPFAHGTSSMISGSGNGNDAGSHTHSIAADTTGITIQSSGNHTHTITGSTDSTGQGQPIDMMPPYQTIHYIIRI